MKKALVIRVGSLGDIVLTFPVLQSFKNNGYSVDLVTRGSLLRSLILLGVVNNGIAFDSQEMSDLFKKQPENPARWASLLAKYDYILSYFSEDEVFSQNLLRFAPVMPKFFGVSPEILTGHASQYLLQPLINDGFRIARIFRFPELSRERNSKFFIHPGSGSHEKNWPFENFLFFAKEISRTGVEVSIILGECEENNRELWLKEFGDGSVISSAPIEKIVHLFLSGKWYLGNDSGITHLAAACGLMTYAVFGPTDPPIWAPVGNNVRIFRSTSCPPCGSGRSKCTHHRKCLQDIDAKGIIKEVLKDISAV